MTRTGALPTVLEDAFATGEVMRPDGSRTPLRSNVSHEEAQRLYDVVRARDPSATIELGLAQGISALAIAQALHDNGSGAHHHVVDPFQQRYNDVGLANLDRAGLRGLVEFHAAFPEEVVPRFPTAEFAFIDASHLFDLSVLDFVLVDKRLAVGGLIGFHDLWLGSLLKLVRYVLANRSYRLYPDVMPPALPPKERWKARAGSVARRVPRADRLFRPEVLRPASDLGVRHTMAFLEKTGDDDRHFRFHREF